MAAAASPLSDDRVTDWLFELQRLTTKAVSLSPAARAAVIAVINTFEAEDGFLPDAAVTARTLLAFTAVVPEASTSYPSIAEAFLDALKVNVQTASSPRPVPTAT